MVLVDGRSTDTLLRVSPDGVIALMRAVCFLWNQCCAKKVNLSMKDDEALEHVLGSLCFMSLSRHPEMVRRITDGLLSDGLAGIIVPCLVEICCFPGMREVQRTTSNSTTVINDMGVREVRSSTGLQQCAARFILCVFKQLSSSERGLLQACLKENMERLQECEEQQRIEQYHTVDFSCNCWSQLIFVVDDVL